MTTEIQVENGYSESKWSIIVNDNEAIRIQEDLEDEGHIIIKVVNDDKSGRRVYDVKKML